MRERIRQLVIRRGDVENGQSVLASCPRTSRRAPAAQKRAEVEHSGAAARGSVSPTRRTLVQCRFTPHPFNTLSAAEARQQGRQHSPAPIVCADPIRCWKRAVLIKAAAGR
jgi:hypothetical protein